SRNQRHPFIADYLTYIFLSYPIYLLGMFDKRDHFVRTSWGFEDEAPNRELDITPKVLYILSTSKNRYREMIGMKELHTIEEWQEVLEKSKGEPVLLLKHSTTCPISTSAFSRVENFETDLPKYY